MRPEDPIAAPPDIAFSVTDGRNNLGTAFAVNVLDSTRLGTFLLTAAHSIRYAWRSGTEVTVLSADGNKYTANLLACNSSEYPDIGLLHVEDRFTAPVTSVSHTSPGAIIVRGSPSGVLTEQATIRGWNYGQELISSELYLDLVLTDLSVIEPTKSVSEKDAESSDVYSALRGLSGAPVIIADALNTPAVIGMVAKRNVRGIANRVYATPIRSAAEYLLKEGFFLQIALPPLTIGPSLGALAGRLMVRVLESSSGMHELWEEVSGLFYQGLPMDQLLYDAIRNPSKYGIEEGIAIHELEYLLARLLQKRGRVPDAARLLRSAGQGASLGRSPEHRRLSALVRLREMGGLAFGSQSAQRWTMFDRALGTYEDLTEFSEDERAYEVASALGAEAGDLSIDERFLDGDDRAQAHFAHMARKHHELVRMYPRWLLDRQEVVGVMLELTTTLWGIGSDLPLIGQAEPVLGIVARGTAAALQRSNAIFYSQMMVGRAAAARAVSDDETAFFLAGLAADALAKSHLTLGHEGLKVLYAYLQRTDPILAEFMRVVSARGSAASLVYLLNQPLLDSRSERNAMIEALRQVVAVSEQISSVSDLLQLML